MKRGLGRLQKRIEELEAFDPQSVSGRGEPKVEALGVAIDDALTLAFGHNTVERLRYKDAEKLDRGNNWGKLTRDSAGRNSPQQDAVEARAFLAEGKERSLTLLRQAVAGLEEDIRDRERDVVSTAPALVAPTRSLSKVFLVHGHDEAFLQTVARFLEKLDLALIVLKEQPDQGRTIIEKFEDCANEVGFAVVLLSPDDVVQNGKRSGREIRARQNVIFELGYFAGKLKRGRVCLMRNGEVEIPSDLYGVLYSEFGPCGGWKVKLVQELKAAGVVAADKAWP